MDLLVQSDGKFTAWDKATVPVSTRDDWPKFVKLMKRLVRNGNTELPSQLHLVRRFYEPYLENKYDNSAPRLRDLEQLEQLASRFPDRQTMLTQITLDPPTSTEDFAGPPLLDEDYLILSTIHSAKGLEWDSVYVIHAADGNIPSDMATRNNEEIEEELRLFYVALTRAKDHLYVCYPLRYYHVARGPRTDNHSFAQLTRFIPSAVKRHFECRNANEWNDEHDDTEAEIAPRARRIRSQIQAMWS
jgi:DNA helicase-2/ATP-dependent DNA helicase PcrA